MAKMIHMMIRVNDLRSSEEFYAKAFDLKRKYFLDFEDFSLAYLKNENSDFELELTYNKNVEENYTHGTGYGHLAFVVDDLHFKQQFLKECGYEVGDIKEFHANGNKIAKFFFVTDPNGFKIEVLEQYGHYR